MGINTVDRLLVAIGYPEKIPKTDEPFALRVDGKEVIVEESAGRIVLSHALTEDVAMLPAFAAYAAGRMLREDAVLAYGSLRHPHAQASKHLVFLWQDAPADADDRVLVRLFETFMDSCDWWRARIDERGNGDAVEISEAVIRP